GDLQGFAFGRADPQLGVEGSGLQLCFGPGLGEQRAGPGQRYAGDVDRGEIRRRCAPAQFKPAMALREGGVGALRIEGDGKAEGTALAAAQWSFAAPGATVAALQRAMPFQVTVTVA